MKKKMHKSGLSVTRLEQPASRNGTPCKLIPLCRQTPGHRFKEKLHDEE
jgi:hypothetical protein